MKYPELGSSVYPIQLPSFLEGSLVRAERKGRSVRQSHGVARKGSIVLVTQHVRVGSTHNDRKTRWREKDWWSPRID